MNIGFKFAPHDCHEWDLTRAFARILHSDSFAPRSEGKRLISISKLTSNENPAGGVGSDGTGTLIVPSEKIGNKLLKHLRNNPLKIDKRKLSSLETEFLPKDWLSSWKRLYILIPTLKKNVTKSYVPWIQVTGRHRTVRQFLSANVSFKR